MIQIRQDHTILCGPVPQWNAYNKEKKKERRCMKRFFAGLGMVGVAAYGSVLVTCLVSWFYGLVLAFRASTALGVVSFFVEPSYLVYGFAKLFAGVDIAAKIVRFFSN